MSQQLSCGTSLGKIKCKSASLEPKNYITDNFGSEYPSAIKQAALLLIEYWEQHRKDGGEVSVNGNYLPIPVLSLLNLYRKPTV